MMKSTPECLIRLNAHYNNLNPATKKVADYILANPMEVIENNIVDLAEKIQVSQFSVINCIKTLGYNGYKDFKLSLARDLVPSSTTLFDGISEKDDAYKIFCIIVQKKIQSLLDTTKIIEPSELNKAAEMISKANRIEIYGIGYSAFAADNLSMNLRRLGKNTAMLHDIHYQMMSASLMTDNDLAIGFSTSGSSKSVVKSLELSRENGASTIAITSFANSPITQFADVVLLTTYSEPKILKDTNSSIVEQVALVSAITLAVAHIDAPHAILNLSETSALIKK